MGYGKTAKKSKKKILSIFSYSAITQDWVKTDGQDLKKHPRHKTLVNCCGEFNIWIKSVRNVFKIGKIVEKTKSKLRGHFQYYGVTDNMYYLEKFNYRVKQSLHHWLNKRSQKKSFTWNSFWNFIEEIKLPTPKIFHSVI